MKNINENLPDKFFVTRSHVHQYAEGVTGTNRYHQIHANEGKGFDSKKEASAAAKAIAKKDKTKVSKQNQGYGALGHFYQTPEIVQGKDLKMSEGYGYPTHRIILNHHKD